MRAPWFTDAEHRGHDPRGSEFERLGRADLLLKVVPKTFGCSYQQFRRRRAKAKAARRARRLNR